MQLNWLFKVFVAVRLMAVDGIDASFSLIPVLLEQHNPTRCVQIVEISPTSLYSKLVYELIVANNFSVLRLSLDALVENEVKFRLNGRKSIEKTCNSFVLFVNSSQDLNNLLNYDEEHAKRFYPHSKLFVFCDNVPDWSTDQMEYVRDEALIVYWLLKLDKDPSLMWLQHSLNGQSIMLNNSTSIGDLVMFLKMAKRFVLMDSDDVNAKRPFRVRHIYCPPYVFPVIFSNGSISHYDGLEYRFLMEITRHWDVKSVTNDDPYEFNYEVGPNDLMAGRCDLSMCSMWMDVNRAYHFDITGYFDFHCGTFLVRKPAAFPTSSYIYLSMSHTVWLLLLVCLVLTAYLQTAFARLFVDYRACIYLDIGRSFLDLVGVASGHGLHLISSYAATRLLSLSWIVLSLLAGVAYTTRYTSLLTKPLFEEPINTLQEFIDKNLQWGYLYNINQFSDLINGSKNYRLLLERASFEHNLSERVQRVHASADYAIMTKVLKKINFISDIQEYLHEILNMRLMRSCFYNHYTVFLLRKHSRYTEYFNEMIYRFQESGIFDRWAGQLEHPDNRDMRQFFQTDRTQSEPVSLNMDSISGALIVLFVGWVFSGVAFVGELTISRWRRH